MLVADAALGLLLVSAPPAREPLVLSRALVLPALAPARREVLHEDPVEQRIVLGTWQPPRAGDTLRGADGKPLAWREAKADEKGAIGADDLAGGYLSWQFDLPSPRILLLDASGHAMVYVNGVPRTGDPYGEGWTVLPVKLRAGRNELLFRVARPVKASLAPPPSDAFLEAREPTLPDLVAGGKLHAPGAVVVVNATDRWLDGMELGARVGEGGVELREPVPRIPPLSLRKVPFWVDAAAPAEPGKATLLLSLRRRGAEQPLDSRSLDLDVRGPHEARRITFTSALDSSVQYYALLPALSPADDGARPALILSLHGASVEAIGQARAYGPKAWADLVAPTNRRPYGFDWEDWGRDDALEVLALAARDLGTDPRRTYLTGHSMGGHGAWQLGVTFPDRFAAIAPSAGWASFWTYQEVPRPAGDTEVEELLCRASNPSDTPRLMTNLGALGVYVLHGDADDNVPVREAREQRERLAPWHHDLEWHEQPGAGHWWDASHDVPGADCVDWPALMDFLARHAIAPSPRHVDFATMSPGVSAAFPQGAIVAQEHPLELSRVQLDRTTDGRHLTGTTANVLRLQLATDHGAGDAPVSLELDGTRLEVDDAGPAILLEKRDGAWRRVPAFPPGDKGPARCGGFKEAFRNRPLLVYGTGGTRAENAWAFAKARYDAETFWYRGNGDLPLVADRDFDAAREADRNVVLYGNADTNRAWTALLGASPVQARRGVVRVGKRSLPGDDLACLFVRPRPGSDGATVGVVSGTGLAGMRLCDRVPLFVSGIGLPDLLVLDPRSLSAGSAGLRAAGYFATDWSLAGADVACAR